MRKFLLIALLATGCQTARERYQEELVTGGTPETMANCIVATYYQATSNLDCSDEQTFEDTLNSCFKERPDEAKRFVFLLIKRGCILWEFGR